MWINSFFFFRHLVLHSQDKGRDRERSPNLREPIQRIGGTLTQRSRHSILNTIITQITLQVYFITINFTKHLLFRGMSWSIIITSQLLRRDLVVNWTEPTDTWNFTLYYQIGKLEIVYLLRKPEPRYLFRLRYRTTLGSDTHLRDLGRSKNKINIVTFSPSKF